MATRQIALNTEPHTAEIGPYRLQFAPEVYGDQFLDSYGRLQEVQKQFSGTDVTTMGGEQLRNLYREMRSFLSGLLTAESAAEFNRFEVRAGSKVLGNYRTREEAESHAEGVKTPTTVEDKSIRLPDRVLVELMEWAVELYAGAGARPTGSSSGSARSSSKGGTSGKGRSRSKASIPAGGPSVPS